MDRPEERLALIEWLDRDGHVLRAVDVWRWPVSIGRALDNTVVLDDPHVAAHHVVIEQSDIEPSSANESEPTHETMLGLRVLAGLNAVHVDAQALAAGERRTVPSDGMLLQLGHTRLRLRLRGETLAAEQTLALAMPPNGLRLASCALVMAALLAAANWIGLDPGADLTAWLPLLLGFPALIALWCGLWALVSKLFQGRFDFMGHAAIALPWFLIIEVLDLALPQLAAALGWPLLWRMTGPLAAVLMAWLLYQHFCLVLPRMRRGIGVAIGAMLLCWAGVTWTLNWRQHDRLDAAPYMPVLPMAGWRVGTPSKPDDLLEAMQPLRERLKARVDKAARDEPEAGDSGE